MAMKVDMLNDLLKECKTQEDLFGEQGVIKQLVKAAIEKVLQAELTTHLGYEKHAVRNKLISNSRNGCSTKVVKGEFGEVALDIPRDREGDYTPQLISRGQTRLAGFDEKILALYARGMTTRDIQAQLQELYGVEVSATLISNVTEAVSEEVKAWQCRTVESVYPIVYFDALIVKIRDNKQIINKAIHLALGVNLEGQKELLGVWVSQTEGAKFWLSVLTELKNRGLRDIFIACVDGLTGFPAAIESIYPQTKVQLCIVHLIRNSLKYVSWKDRKALAADLKKIYSAKTVDEAELSLLEFAEKWDKSYASISILWRRHWANIIPFFAYPTDIRKVIYTTNAVESLNMTLRKVLKNKRLFPSDEAAFKQIYLAIQNISKKWTMPIRDWKAALSYFAIAFEERIFN